MALEELIVAWSRERPAWQREVMRRVAVGEPLSEGDYDALVENILKAGDSVSAEFGLEQFHQAAFAELPVTLVAIEKSEHVNALESKEPLTFEKRGLTIVYGDNGSGKSGYARLLKRIARARHQEEILTDVFRDTSLMRPSAMLTIRIGDAEETMRWPESARPELRRMLFFDSACCGAYISHESDFPYRPSALFVLDGLIAACVAVRARVDAKLAGNGAAAKPLVAVPEDLRGSKVGQFLAGISATSSIEALDSLVSELETSAETIDDLKNQEAELRHADTTLVRQQRARQGAKLAAVRDHIRLLDSVIGPAAQVELQRRQAEATTLSDAVTSLARLFDAEPLPDIGNRAWQSLWTAAEAFSKEHAYPGREFPFLGQECRCVLCQQPLDAESRARFLRFREFVRNDSQVRLQTAKRAYEDGANAVRDLIVTPEAVLSNLADLEDTHADIVNAVRTLLVKYKLAQDVCQTAPSVGQPATQTALDPTSTISRLQVASEAAYTAVQELGNPEGVQRHLAALSLRRAELELLDQVKKSRSVIIGEIARLKEREALEAVKTAAATTGITKKILELSEESITEVVRDTFTRESDRLRLERVTIARTRADKGALLHQPKLVGARQQVTLPRVFSEGERTALGLAAFFTEAQLDASKSALILDDPVTSLDHIRRDLVATRLTAFAQDQQVVLFTHDVAFVADLKREAAAKGVPVAERSVIRSRGEEGKPGACASKHPWKAKDASARLGELRQELGRIKRESAGWDDKQYEDAVAVWAGNLSETWERIFSQEVVGPVLAEGGLEVRPMMVKVLARFSDDDHREFDGSYSRASQWARRHDKSAAVNYVAPEVDKLGQELELVETWFKRVKGYKT